MWKQRVLFLVSMGLLACGIEDADDGSGEDRHPIGKADLVGSCEPDTCGGLSDGNCWCDDLCAAFGDCCSNAPAVCGVEVDCGDGSALHPLCDQAPACPEGTDKAIIGGCFQCVDPLTCEPPPASCDDGTALHPLCDQAPACPEGSEKAIIGSCFECVDPVTCEPV